MFHDPQGIAACADGSLVVVDSDNHRIRKISPGGVVSTLAGDGQEGFADGPAAAARFRHPEGIAVRPDGSVVVTDSGNDRIRLISPAGLVSTLAGSGEAGFADGSAAEAKFNGPCGVAVCPDGTVLVCDWDNHRVRRITADGSVSTLAGSGEEACADGIGDAASFYYPCSIAVDIAGNAVVRENHGTIRKIVLATAEVTTVIAHTGDEALDVAIDAAGGIVFDNEDDNTLCKISGAGLGPAFFSAGFPPRWSPTRACRRESPGWTRDAVLAVLHVAQRSRQLGGGGGWICRVPVLPLELWVEIIGLVPRHLIGRAPGGVVLPDPATAQWLVGQMAIEAAGGWRFQAELKAKDEVIATKDEELATKEAANAELARTIAELQALVNLQATGSAQQAGLLAKMQAQAEQAAATNERLEDKVQALGGAV
jgi:sugar lactone lactonase YvrE